jgi:protein TonB
MARNSVAEPHLPEVAEQEKKPRVPQPPVPHPPEVPHRESEFFSEILLEMSTTAPKKRFLDFVVSIAVHTLILAVMILLPLYFTEAIDLKQFTSTFLVAPPPPPPPPPPASPAVAKVRVVPKRVFSNQGRLMAPVVIPEKVAMLKEEALTDDLGGMGVVGGVPGGVPGGQMGGVMGGIIGGVVGSNLPPPPPKAAKTVVRVGGRVKAPQPLYTPPPKYTLLAKSAKIEGGVVIDAIIDTTGSVIEMRVVSGHPLLIQAAMDALRQWKYEPTYLNDEPVAVQLLVTIRFRLSAS